MKTPLPPPPTDGSPVRCAVLPGIEPLADEFAALTGLPVDEASQLVDWHLIRGEN